MVDRWRGMLSVAALLVLVGGGGCDSGAGVGAAASGPASVAPVPSGSASESVTVYTAPPKRAKNPRAALVAAGAVLGSEAVRFSGSAGGGSITGVVDARRKLLELSQVSVGGGETTMRRIGPDLYLQSEPGGRWLHTTVGTIPAGSLLRVLGVDAQRTVGMLKTCKKAKGAGVDLACSVDLSQAREVEPLVSSAGRRLRSVPLTAFLDPQGRLLRMAIELDVVSRDGGRIYLEYQEYGKPITVERPAAAEVKPMPSAVRKSLDL